MISESKDFAFHVSLRKNIYGHRGASQRQVLPPIRAFSSPPAIFSFSNRNLTAFFRGSLRCAEFQGCLYRSTLTLYLNTNVCLTADAGINRFYLLHHQVARIVAAHGLLQSALVLPSQVADYLPSTRPSIVRRGPEHTPREPAALLQRLVRPPWSLRLVDDPSHRPSGQKKRGWHL